MKRAPIPCSRARACGWYLMVPPYSEMPIPPKNLPAALEMVHLTPALQRAG